MPTANRTRPLRRRQRSGRLIAAVTMLVLAGGVLAAALMLGTTWALAGGALVSYAAGVTAARVVGTELTRSRHDAARDRAEQARAYVRLADTRTAAYEERLAEQARSLASEQQRAAGLQSTTVTLQRELAERSGQLAEATAQLAATHDMLATWDGADEAPDIADAAAVVDLMAWEQRVKAAGEPRRKQA